MEEKKNEQNSKLNSFEDYLRWLKESKVSHRIKFKDKLIEAQNEIEKSYHELNTSCELDDKIMRRRSLNLASDFVDAATAIGTFGLKLIEEVKTEKLYQRLTNTFGVGNMLEELCNALLSAAEYVRLSDYNARFNDLRPFMEILAKMYDIPRRIGLIVEDVSKDSANYQGDLEVLSQAQADFSPLYEMVMSIIGKEAEDFNYLHRE